MITEERPDADGPAVEPAGEQQPKPAGMSKADLTQLINEMPAIRWFGVRKRYDAGLEECQADPVLMLVVACNERHFQTTGRNDWQRFEEMGIEALGDYLGLADAEDDDDSKSPAGDAGGS